MKEVIGSYIPDLYKIREGVKHLLREGDSFFGEAERFQLFFGLWATFCEITMIICLAYLESRGTI